MFSCYLKTRACVRPHCCDVTLENKYSDKRIGIFVVIKVCCAHVSKFKMVTDSTFNATLLLRSAEFVTRISCALCISLITRNYVVLKAVTIGSATIFDFDTCAQGIYESCTESNPRLSVRCAMLMLYV